MRQKTQLFSLDFPTDQGEPSWPMDAFSQPMCFFERVACPKCEKHKDKHRQRQFAHGRVFAHWTASNTRPHSWHPTLPWPLPLHCNSAASTTLAVVPDSRPPERQPCHPRCHAKSRRKKVSKGVRGSSVEHRRRPPSRNLDLIAACLVRHLGIYIDGIGITLSNAT